VNGRKSCKFCYYYFYDYNSDNLRFSAARSKSDEHLTDNNSNFSFFEFKKNCNVETAPPTTSSVAAAMAEKMDVVDNDHISNLISFNTVTAGQIKAKHYNGSLTDISSLDGSVHYTDSWSKKKK
jgi:hypothetical protein